MSTLTLENIGDVMARAYARLTNAIRHDEHEDIIKSLQDDCKSLDIVFNRLYRESLQNTQVS